MEPASRQYGSATTAVEASVIARAMLGVGDLTAGAGGLAYDQWSLAGGGITVGRMVSRGDTVRLAITRPPDLVGVHVTAGLLTLRRGDEAAVLGPGDCGLVDLQGRTELQWDSVHVELYCVPVATMLRLLPRPPFAQRLEPRSAELGRFWLLLAQLLTAHVMTGSDLRRSDLICSTMVDAFAATTIEAFDVDCDPPADDRAGLVVAKAEAYLQHHLGDAVSLGDIARAVELSPRGLQLAYQQSGAETPTEHLRRLRLEAARRTLARGGGTVTHVAREHGYTNVGRFSAHYRDAFAESPTATLRRSSR